MEDHENAGRTAEVVQMRDFKERQRLLGEAWRDWQLFTDWTEWTKEECTLTFRRAPPAEKQRLSRLLYGLKDAQAAAARKVEEELREQFSRERAELRASLGGSVESVKLKLRLTETALKHARARADEAEKMLDTLRAAHRHLLRQSPSTRTKEVPVSSEKLAEGFVFGLEYAIHVLCEEADRRRKEEQFSAERALNEVSLKLQDAAETKTPFEILADYIRNSA